MTFYREILGERGIARQLYPTHDQWSAFCKTKEYREIQGMLRKLMRRGVRSEKTGEPTCVLTVRLPKSLHDLLQTEAFLSQTSINQLCIAKLLQVFDSEPEEESGEQVAKDHQT